MATLEYETPGRPPRGPIATLLIYQSLLIMGVFLVFVLAVPRFEQIFKDFRAPLPSATEITLAISRALRDGSMVRIGAILLLNTAWVLLLRQWRGRRAVFIWLVILLVVLPALCTIALITCAVPLFTIVQ